MKRITEDRGRLIWHMRQDSDTDLTIDDFAIKADTDALLYKMPFGAVIAQDGTVWRLKHYGTHGCVAAILCPDIAEEFGVYQPREKPPHMAFQEFELECKNWLPLIRISTRFGLNISWGRCEAWPQQEQINSLAMFLKINGWYEPIVTEIEREGASPGARGVLGTLLRGEEDPMWNEHRKTLNKLEMENNPEKYKVFDPKEWY
jgi:hypothetical protein